MIAGVGNDTIWHAFFVPTSDLVFANEGNDTVWVSGGGGADTVFAGQGNDSIFHNSAGTADTSSATRATTRSMPSAPPR